MRLSRFLYNILTIIIGVLFISQFNLHDISFIRCFLLGFEIAVINYMGYFEHKTWG